MATAPTFNSNLIKIETQNTTVLALIDTGASRSCVSQRWLSHLGSGIRPSPLGPTESNTMYAADGREVKIDSKVSLDIKIKGLCIQYEFLVVRSLTQNIIFGMDFLNATQAQINCATNTVTFYDDLLAVPFLTNIRTARNVVRVSKHCVLPPMSETVVPAYSTNSTFNGRSVHDCFLLEALPAQEDRPFLVARSINVPRDSKLVCRVLNPTNDVVHLRKRQPIAQLEMIDNADIIELPLDFFDFSKKSTPVAEAAINTLDGAPPSSRETPHVTMGDLGIKIENDDLTPGEKKQLSELIESNSDLFASGLDKLPGSNLAPHVIDTGDARPIRQRAYNHPPAVRRVIERETADMLKNEIIEESTSAWSSPCLVIRKPSSDSWRFCVDFRRLNSVIKPASFPLTNMEEITQSLGEAKPCLFTVFDLKSAYWQCHLDPSTREKTSFSTPDGQQFQYTRLPMGLANSSAAFLSLMSRVFRGLLFKNLIIYADDLMVFSSSFQGHMSDLQAVFDKLRAANLRIHPQKCKVAVSNVKYLGHMFSAEGCQVNPDKVKILREYPRPTNAKELRQLLGLSNFYKKFIRGYSVLANDLYALLKKDQPFVWNEKCEAAFIALKTALCEAPLLVYPDNAKQYRVATDASSKGLGWIISQMDDRGRERPVLFGGRSLHASEVNYGITDLEALAFVECVRQNHALLAHNHFLLFTDHISLKWLRDIRHRKGRLYRYSLLLQPYQYTVHHKPGRLHTNADVISRLDNLPVTPEDPLDDIYDEIAALESPPEPLEPGTVTEIRFEYSQEGALTPDGTDSQEPESQFLMTLSDIGPQQADCPDIGRLVRYLTTEELPLDHKKARQTIFEAENCVLENGILYHIDQIKNKNLGPGQQATKQVVVPLALRNQLLHGYHSDMGHLGQERTVADLRLKYWFPNLVRTTRTFIKECLQCQRAKRDYHASNPKMQPLPVTDIHGRWSIDVLGPFSPPGPDGEKYVLLLVETMSRWPEAYPIKDQKADTIAEILYREIICRHGAMESLLSDRGTSFLSDVIKSLCKLFEIKRLHTSSFHPQSNSACERYNSSILNALRCHLNGKHDQWPNYIAPILAAYRASVCTKSTHYSPYFLMHGRSMRLMADQATAPEVKPRGKTAEEYISKMLPRVELARQIARENALQHQQAMKERFDHNAQDPTYKPGDMVLLRQFKTREGISPKLVDKYDGPYYVTNQSSPSNFNVRHAKTNVAIAYPIHASRLKRFYGNENVIEPQAEAATPGAAQPLSQSPKVPDDTETDIDRGQIPPEPGQLAPGEKVEENDGLWHAVTKLLATKVIAKQRYYRVQWADKTAPPTWIRQENIAPLLIREFHIKRTQTGKVRRQFRHRPRRS